jgi:glutathione S-transferase
MGAQYTYGHCGYYKGLRCNLQSTRVILRGVMMQMLQLIGSLTSPYVRKVRIELAQKGLEYDFILDDVWSPAPQVLQFNPLGQVPCLILTDATVLTDSRSIVDYLDLRVPPVALDGSERVQLIRWQALAEGVMDAAVKYRVEQLRPEGLQSAAWFERQQFKLHRAFVAFDERLRDQAWLVTGQATRADSVLMCALNFIDLRIPDWAWRAEFEYLSRFERLMSERPEFAATAPPLPQV